MRREGYRWAHRLQMTTSATESIWLEGPSPSGFDPLVGEGGHFDAIVVGGGIAGLTTAVLLKETGATVAVLEAGRVGHGVTACTTAKVTALQGSTISTVRRAQGEERAVVYAQASAAAVAEVARLAAEHGIECDLERRAADTFAMSPSEVDSVMAEIEAARDAGLPVEEAAESDLPFEVHAIARLGEQIQFQPVRYVEGLARAVDGDGSVVFEKSRVLSLDGGSPCVAHTARGSASADRVVVATHFPILDRGLYFATLRPSRSYCIAMRIAGSPPRAMSINPGSPKRSIRSAGELLIVGGEGHEPGSSEARPERFERLEEFAREHWDVEEVTHRWSAQDPTPYDDLPVVGPYMPGSSHLFVASGFMKWGLTGGTFAGMILSALLTEGEHPWAPAFDPRRLTLRRLPSLAKHNLKAAQLVTGRLEPAEVGSTDEVPAGEARVVRTGLGKSGYFRDDGGILHGVSLRCTHLGCLVNFNAAERSWDCPCHGSRFDVDGAVLEGPATRPLDRPG
jgi:glycine/D-amino acid oxidase-like deaminating enzyme/nitrite reductase/ring-hydroxylating ferredoxin subunit